MDVTSVKNGQISHLSKIYQNNGPTNLTVIANEAPLRFLLWTGQPLHQPMVAHGPFVMNTKDQIGVAFDDYRAGSFGFIPVSKVLWQLRDALKGVYRQKETVSQLQFCAINRGGHKCLLNSD